MDVVIKAALVGASVASIISLVGVVLNSHLTSRRDRQQLIWRVELDRIIDLEERTGKLVEIVCSSYPVEDVRIQVSVDLERLMNDAGRFRRYNNIKQGIRDTHNVLACIIDIKLNKEDYRKEVDDANNTYETLLGEIDKVFGKRTP